jgi:hypothetical protein
MVEALAEVAVELPTAAEDLPVAAEEFDELADVAQRTPADKEEGGRRRRRRRRSRDTSATERPTAPSDFAEAEPTETPDQLAAEPPGVAAAADSETAEPRDRGPRGRRRRGRREKAAGPEPVSQAESGLPAEAAAQTDLDEHDDLAEEDHGEGEDKSEGVGFRNIPTWSEAIGVIIAKNLESRAKNPNSQRPRGGQRGRGGRNDRRSSNDRG